MKPTLTPKVTISGRRRRYKWKPHELPVPNPLAVCPPCVVNKAVNQLGFDLCIGLAPMQIEEFRRVFLEVEKLQMVICRVPN